MTNLDAHPQEHAGTAAACRGPELKVFQPRTVPLGGIRAMPVRRTLPHRELSLIGAWCFLDQFAGDGEAAMTVLPHPHTALQTVTWPITGEIRHRDSLGNDIHVRPGELNLMTAGAGVSHSEFSRPGDALTGVQLWLALPSGPDTAAAAFEQVTDLPCVVGEGWEFTVFIGELAGARSPATTHTPLLGADGALAPGAEVELPLDPAWEHGLLVFGGEIHTHEEIEEYFADRATPADDAIGDGAIGEGHLAYFGLGRTAIRLTAGPEGARVILLGGEPFTEPVVMFWNFIGRTHDDIARAATAWAEDWREGTNERYGRVPGHGPDHIPGPDLPPVKLRPRRSRHRPGRPSTGPGGGPAPQVRC